MAPILVIDFDSTLVAAETLEVMAGFALEGDAEAKAKSARIGAITRAAMNGQMEFGEALDARLSILQPALACVERTAAALAGMITPSFERNRDVLRRHAGEVFIISGGFHETIDAIAAGFGIGPCHVLANRLAFDDDGRARSVEPGCPLSRSGGKPEMVRSLGLAGEVVAVGDGWTDYEIRAAGAASRFYAFTEVVARERVVAVADRIAASLDEVLRAEGLA